MKLTLNNIDEHINQLLIPHSAYTDSLNKLNEMFRRTQNNNAPYGMTFIGDSGTGKTFVLNCMENEHPAEVTPEGLVKPLLKVTVPPNPTMNELITVLLDALGAPPIPNRDNVATKTKQLETLVKKCGVKMMVLEEYQHFVLRGDKRLYAAADWLKVFIDNTKLAVVISGLTEARQALDMNEQLARRFSVNVQMPRFDWQKASDQNEFRSIMKAFQTGLEGIDFPSLSSYDLSFRFYLATGGLISNIKKILQEAAYRCLSLGRGYVALEDLAATWDLTMKQPSHKKFNPFSSELDAANSDTNPELLAFARSIGVSAGSAQ